MTRTTPRWLSTILTEATLEVPLPPYARTVRTPSILRDVQSEVPLREAREA